MARERPATEARRTAQRFRPISPGAAGSSKEGPVARGGRYFTVEGRIRDQFYYGGRYWNDISVTHRRNQFEKVMQGRVGQLLAPGRRVKVPPL